MRAYCVRNSGNTHIHQSVSGMYVSDSVQNHHQQFMKIIGRTQQSQAHVCAAVHCCTQLHSLNR